MAEDQKPSIHVLYDGYSYLEDGIMRANCSCVLIKGKTNVVVDTLTAWDKEKLLQGLAKHELTPDDISYVIGTHGHSDHVGNHNIFTNAKQHIVGFTISYKDTFYLHPFDTGEDYDISEDVSVIPTPGHMREHVSVKVNSSNNGIVLISGDLFEKEEDIASPLMWQDAGTEDVVLQKKHRSRVADMADYIVPGHGPMFKVTQDHRRTLQFQLNN